jgi:hypothetical protein
MPDYLEGRLSFKRLLQYLECLEHSIDSSRRLHCNNSCLLSNETQLLLQKALFQPQLFQAACARLFAITSFSELYMML